MDTSAMVGSMGLTFFCNKCVEVFYKFSIEGVVSPELTETCRRAISAFKSLEWPKEQDVPSGENVALFNTNEEIKSFERVASESGQADEILTNLIRDLESMLQENSAETKKDVAKKLQKFFDTLGDYSFYTTRDCLRESPTTIGV